MSTIYAVRYSLRLFDHLPRVGGAAIAAPYSGIGRAITIFLLWRERARLRRDLRQLLALDRNIREDFVLDECDLRIESSKPFWR
jgi:uncharacterized protein YjiS (DUF1127 family)